MAERIMSTLKRELTIRYLWRNRLDLELALVTYMAGTTPGAGTADWRRSTTGSRDARHPCKCSSSTIRPPPGQAVAPLHIAKGQHPDQDADLC